MNACLLVALCASVLLMMWLFLDAAFRCIEKAHEHLRETEHSRGSAELVKGTGS